MHCRTRIKICGLTRPEDVEAAVEAGADALGFVFYRKSPRHVAAEAARALMAAVPPFITKVGLFVNVPPEEAVETAVSAGLSLLQFHGDETVETCAAVAEAARLPFIRAFRVGADTRPQDLVQCEKQYRAASPRFSGLLLDSHSEAYGGTGKVFNWSLVSKEIAHRVVLSGGLNAQNVAGAIRLVQPYAVDVSSGVESIRGVKDAGLIRAFVRAVRMADPAG